MRSAVAILLAFSLIAMPMRAWSSDCCCRGTHESAADLEPAESTSCCTSRSSAPDETPEAPADAPGPCKCPARCCSPLPAFACVPFPTKASPNGPALPELTTIVIAQRGEDHLDRLKRPPRA